MIYLLDTNAVSDLMRADGRFESWLTAAKSCSPTGTGYGVIDAGHRSSTVVNGSVRGMGNSGINLNDGGSVERVHADSNGNAGIQVDKGTMIGNTANFNGSDGLRPGGSSIFGATTASGNTAIGNGGSGISVGCPSSVVGNTAVSNGQMNLQIIGAGCAVANNAAP